MKKTAFIWLTVLLLVSFNSFAQIRGDTYKSDNKPYNFVKDSIEKYSSAINGARIAIQNDNFEMLRYSITIAISEADDADESNYEQANYPFLNKLSNTFYLCEISNIAIASFDSNVIRDAISKLSGEILNEKIFRKYALTRIDQAIDFADKMTDILGEYLTSGLTNNCSSDDESFKNKLYIVLGKISEAKLKLLKLKDIANDLKEDPATRVSPGIK